jgi:multidrug efflux system outer membrane protein
VSQVRSQYQQALAAVPALERQVAVQENLISILVGRNPGSIPRGKTIAQLALPAVPGDLPASILGRRPDILQAEQNLVAANANIGAARALYFPSFSITGVAGSLSTALSDFGTSPAASGTLAATVAGPLFTFGTVSGQVASAKAGQREALAFYQQVIQNALRETNDALIGSQKKGEESAALGKRVDALREYARLSRLRFDNGTASYLEVLYAENELFGAELAAVRAQAERYAELINVYKAFGGGWVDLVDPLAPPVAAASGPAAAPATPTSTATPAATDTAPEIAPPTGTP